MNKKILVLVSFLFLMAFNSPGETLIKTVASTATPEKLGTRTVRFKSVTFFALKAERTANTGKVWIQISDSTNGAKGIPLETGQSVTIYAAADGFSENDFWIDVETNGDGVMAVYFEQ